MLSMPRTWWLVLLPMTASCGTVYNWREVRSGPATQAEVYDAVEYLARTDGFQRSEGECDRGLAVWASRWRYRQIGLGRPGRYKLRAEVLLENGSKEEGWVVRYIIEQQKVKDLGRSLDPAETDWSNDGQDGEREFLFGQRLQMRLGAGAATGREPPDNSGRGR